MMKASEIKSVMEEEIGMKMPYSKPKRQQKTLLNLRSRAKKNGYEEDRTFIAVGYKLVPITTVVSDLTGACAKVLASGLPLDSWIEAVDGFLEAPVTVSWVKTVEANDNIEQLRRECEEKHLRKLKGIAYNNYQKTQTAMRTGR